MGNSGSGPSTPTPATASDPSMEDILASIRRILNEDDKAPEAEHPEATAEPAESGTGETVEDSVLLLDESMMVEPDLSAHEPQPETLATGFGHADPEPLRPGALIAPSIQIAATPLEALSPRVSTEDLIGAVAADAAANSVGNLVRTLAAERNTQVYRGGPSIEDLVLLEIRPLLKSWLDLHLPGLVERLVQAEIERVVKRAL